MLDYTYICYYTLLDVLFFIFAKTKKNVCIHLYSKLVCCLFYAEVNNFNKKMHNILSTKERNNN